MDFKGCKFLFEHRKPILLMIYFIYYYYYFPDLRWSIGFNDIYFLMTSLIKHKYDALSEL